MAQGRSAIKVASFSPPVEVLPVLFVGLKFKVQAYHVHRIGHERWTKWVNVHD